MSACLINFIKIFSRKLVGPCTATTNNMEQNKDDWNSLMESLELDDLQNRVNNIAEKFDFKITKEISETKKDEKEERKQEKSDFPLTPDYANKLKNYLNTEDYTPLKKCKDCGEMFQYKKHICNQVNYDLEIFTRPEDRIDQQSEQQPEKALQEDEYQDLFKQIESLDFSQNEVNYPTSEPIDQAPSIENDIEIIDLEDIIQNEILEILDPIEFEEEDIIEVPNDSTEDFDSPTNEYNPEIEEIEEVLTRQETKNEKRLREFQKINRYFSRKLRENPNFEVEKFREMVFSENGELKYQGLYGPPVPTSQMIRQLFEKNEDGFRIMNQDLESFLRKFSDRVYKFFKKFPQIKEPFEYCRTEDITKTRKILTSTLYAAYHSIYNKNSSNIAPHFPEVADDFNYRFWEPYVKNILKFVPDSIRYQFILEDEFHHYKRIKKRNHDQEDEDPPSKLAKKNPNI